jgi:hypothetical protein
LLELQSDQTQELGIGFFHGCQPSLNEGSRQIGFLRLQRPDQKLLSDDRATQVREPGSVKRGCARIIASNGAARIAVTFRQSAYRTPERGESLGDTLPLFLLQGPNCALG